MRALVLALALVVLSLCSPAEAGQDSDAFAHDLERDVPGLLDRYEVPSAAIAIIEDGTLTWSRRFDADGAHVDGEAFKVASLSKTAAAMAVMSLAERGDLDLDAPVDRYLTRWKVPSSRFDESKVTARRLLSHTAGFPLMGRVRPPARRYPPVEDILEGRHHFAPVRLVSEPGTRFTYSNPGYTVLELLVEEVTRKSFPDAMRELVFEPLGMSETVYDDQAGFAHVVPGYLRTGRPGEVDRLVSRGPGGMASMSRDIAKLIMGASLPKEDGGLLQPATLRAMHTVPEVAQGAFGLGGEDGYALGIASMGLPSGRTIVANNGSFTGYNSMMLGLPAGGAGLVVLTNSNTGIGLELELFLKWTDVVVGERPGFASRIQAIRSGIRWGTLALLLVCLALLARAIVLVRRGRRAWPHRIGVRKLLLKTLPLVALGGVLIVVLGTGRLTEMLGGIPPARFVSGDYQWIVTVFALSLVAIGVFAVALPKRRDT